MDKPTRRFRALAWPQFSRRRVHTASARQPHSSTLITKASVFALGASIAAPRFSFHLRDVRLHLSGPIAERVTSTTVYERAEP
jgi:hypothetical protein